MKVVKLLSLFSGIGAFEKALKNLNINYELVNYCEIDKYASKAYSVIHGIPESYNLWDVKKIKPEELPDFNMMTWGFPCQDISIAGEMQGIKEGTRSGLYYYAFNILATKRPAISIIENVKNLCSKRFADKFQMILADIEALGYNNYYKILNAKDFNIPQNRERVFIISIRKDIDKKDFKFPEGKPLELKLKDLLEKEVDRKYYLKDEQLKNLVINQNMNCNPSGKGINGKVYSGDVVGTITTNKGEGIKVVANLNMKGHESINRVYSENGISPTLTGMQGGNTQPKIIETPCIVASRGRNPDNPSDRTAGAHVEQRLEVNQKGISNAITTVQKDNYVIEKYNTFIKEEGYVPELFNPYHRKEVDKIAPTQTANCGSMTSSSAVLKKEENVKIKEATKKGYTEAELGDSINLSYPSSQTRRGRVGKQVSQTITQQNHIGIIDENIKIRKLTPTECWRLMGFTDRDINKCINAGISNSQLYKMAGNSIVVNVLEEIYKNLLKN